MAANFAEIWVKLGLKKDDFDKGIKEVEGGTKKLDQSFTDTIKSTAALGVGIAAAGTAIVAAGKQIYEFGKQGAVVTQTADSFDYLSKKLELPSDLLEQLRKASRGTVDDMTLMSSTSTLLAGTTDELGKALGSATPQLLEIAKAANKLNPSLGTTSHMYESIALGIKRASPMILDNLGLTIKIGDANEEMAKKLGKSVDALTAEEKQMALLEATLKAGDNLIQQVGGSTESATDAYEQNAAAVKNLKDALSATVNEGIYPLIQGFADFYSAAIPARDAYALMHEAMEKGIITEEEMIELDRQQADGLISLEEIIANLTAEIENADLAQGLLNSQMEEAKMRYLGAKDGAIELTEAIDDTKYSMKELSLFIQGPLGKEYDNFNQKQSELKAEMDEVQQKILELEGMEHFTEEQYQQLDEAQIEYAELKMKYDEFIGAHGEGKRKFDGFDPPENPGTSSPTTSN